MAKRYDDLPLEEQLTMPDSFQRELLGRPPEFRGEDARNPNTGQLCTRYYRRQSASGRWEWQQLIGADCSRRAVEAPTATAAPKPTANRCTIAGPYVAQSQRWDMGQAGNPAFVSRWLNDYTRIAAQSGPVCSDEVHRLDAEITRWLTVGGGNRNLVPLSVKPVVQALADTIRRASSYTVATGYAGGGRALTIPSSPTNLFTARRG